MKKLFALLLAVCMVMAFAACGNTNEPTDPPFDPSAKSEGVMTHAEYLAAPVDTEVTVECFVQGYQGWWADTITVYAQDPDGGYFLYGMACSEADSKKLVPGTKIRVTGDKAIYNGEIEIMNATFEFCEGTWIAETKDLTSLLGTEELIKHQNEKASFKGLTVESITYKNDQPGDDIWLTMSKDGVSCSFTVEIYLTGETSDVYTTVSTLKVGDKVDVETFLYWYEGMDAHITSITVVE